MILESLCVKQVHEQPVSRVAFANDGATMATADAEGSVSVWRFGEPAAQISFGSELFPRNRRVVDLALDPQGTRLFVATPTGLTAIESHTGDIVWRIAAPETMPLMPDQPLAIGRSRRYGLGIAFSSGSMGLWDLDGRPIREWRHFEAPRMGQFADFEPIWIASDGFTISSWDMVQGKQIQRRTSQDRHYALAVSPFDGVIAVRTLRAVMLVSLNAETPSTTIGIAPSMPTLALCPVATRLALGHAEGAIVVDYTSGEVSALAEPGLRLTHLSFLPGSSVLVTGWADGTMRFFSTGPRRVPSLDIRA